MLKTAEYIERRSNFTATFVFILAFHSIIHFVAIQKTDIEEFLRLARKQPVLDVRSPGEFKHAHIPGAYSLPLFTDEERTLVGTAYKQQSRETAIKLGLDFFGPKMRRMVEEVEELTKNSSNRQVLVHCWRGGMRSAGVAWLLDLYGFKVCTLVGGYKKYRQRAVATFSMSFPFSVLGGFTGSGKTYVLKEMKKAGATVVDLEQIAVHKGSAFGNIGMPNQPSQEMFENILSESLRTAMADQPSQIWLEDESQRIGTVNIPTPLWNSMRQAPILFLNIPFEERLKHIVSEYGNLDKERMANAIDRIRKRLGGLETKTALQHLADGDTEACFRILLAYYDKWYRKALNNRDQLPALLRELTCNEVQAPAAAAKILSIQTLNT